MPFYQSYIEDTPFYIEALLLLFLCHCLKLHRGTDEQTCFSLDVLGIVSNPKAQFASVVRGPQCHGVGLRIVCLLHDGLEIQLNQL